MLSPFKEIHLFNNEGLFVYEWHDDPSVHEIILEKNDARASQAVLESLIHIYNEADAEKTMRLLLDFRRVGLMPMNSIVKQARQWRQNVHQHPQTRLAILTLPNPAMTLLQPMLNMMRFGHLTTRLFKGDTRDAAMSWLTQSR